MALVSGNNLSVVVGALISGGILRKYSAFSLALIGYILGLILQGSYLSLGANTLFPKNADNILLIVEFIALLVFIFAHMFGIPTSLSIILSSALIGGSLAIGILPNGFYLLSLFLFWIIAPIIGIFASFFLMKIIKSKEQSKDIWKRIIKMKVFLLFASFLNAYSLGANTLGLVYVLEPRSISDLLLSIVAIVIGVLAFSKEEIKLIGNKILDIRYTNAAISSFVVAMIVLLATFLSIPLSNTQVFTASLFGVRGSYKYKISKRAVGLNIALFWALTSIISIFSVFIIAKLFT